MSRKLVAREPFSNGNIPSRFKHQYQSLYICNYGGSEITFKLYTNYGDSKESFTLTLPAGSVFDEYLEPFEKIEVLGSSSFAGFVREER